ncbi:MAG: hypothetical protein KatS3mg102_1094 [Planctomycetota bacterium]|nr:MAG: hypothetical protein KatS3mg102_1094 [Planctomycetota bacterium]
MEGEPTAPAHPPATILVVDDDESVRAVLVGLLRNAGFEVLAAASGEQALARLQAGAPAIDLVVLDMNMPGMDGAATFRAIAARHPGTKVMLMSGAAGDAEVRPLLQAGALCFLPKPQGLRGLVGRVRAALCR